MRTVHRDIVSAVLVSKDGKLLQAKQTVSPRRPYPGKWAIIGGGTEDGEGKRAALDREVKEETGIDISKYSAELVYKGKGEAEKTLRTGERVIADMDFYTYRVVMDDKNADEIAVALDEEHSEYRWCEVSELKSMELTGPSIELYGHLGYL